MLTKLLISAKFNNNLDKQMFGEYIVCTCI